MTCSNTADRQPLVIDDCDRIYCLAGWKLCERRSLVWQHSLDHLVGEVEQRRGDFEAERPGGLDVDH
jgi:hypothetical protein